MQAFEPLYYADRLVVVNPYGDVGVTSLWSKVESAQGVLERAGVNLSRETSRISVISNLYGNGLPQMLRNLFWNPQIRHVVIMGENLSGSREWLLNFFKEGLEEVEFLGSPTFRIRGTDRIIDGELRPENFLSIPNFSVFGKVSSDETKTGIEEFFAKLPPFSGTVVSRTKPPEIPQPTVTRFPSEPRGHTIIRDAPMEAWQELVFHLYRFGYRTSVAKRKGTEGRVELQNVKVVVENPTEEPEDLIKSYGFSLEHFHDYQQRMLDSVRPVELEYSYGNRLRGYFSHGGEVVDALTIFGGRLKEKPDSRHAMMSLWDSNRDTPEGTGCPCFDSVFFRQFDGVLTMTATFRTHNTMSAWPENFYGLMAIQSFVAQLAGLLIGPITVFSRSISIDTASLEKAKQISELRKTDEVIHASTGKFGPRMDPYGEFTVTIDAETKELVVEHLYQGAKLCEYRGKTAEDIERQLARDKAVSLISHALYLGRELARAQVRLRG